MKWADPDERKRKGIFEELFPLGIVAVGGKGRTIRKVMGGGGGGGEKAKKKFMQGKMPRKKIRAKKKGKKKNSCRRKVQL